MATVYLSGNLGKNEDDVFCTLHSSVVLFIVRYCQAKPKLVFVNKSDLAQSSYECHYKVAALSNFIIEFSSWQNLPSLVKNVALPAVHQPEHLLIRSGLCGVLRHIIQESHQQNPSLNLVDLLGFKQGSLKMCAEVSSWTKLCEVDIPDCVKYFMSKLQTSNSENEKSHVLPSVLMRLEQHFKEKVNLQNINKLQRREILQLKKAFAKCPKDEMDSKCSAEEVVNKLNSLLHSDNSQTLILNALTFDNSHIFIDNTIQLSHGIRRFTINKEFCRKDVSGSTCMTKEMPVLEDKLKDENEGCRQISPNSFDLSSLLAAVTDLSFSDIEYKHVYSEGIELTIADLILITYIYHLLSLTGSMSLNLSGLIPCITRWADHMVNLSNVKTAGQSLGWNFAKMSNSFKCERPLGDEKKNESCIKVTLPEVELDTEDIELNGLFKMKKKGCQLEVRQVINKIETSAITPLVGTHPKGNDIEIDWNSLPPGVHPKEGNVPVKRTQRKCQQLENLATAVQTITKKGDIIVDFCSGGGHLGILCAYLLPDCQVFLVENKEESLMKSSSRLQSLGLKNVTLYQCNLDYFSGKFDVGICLHACGCATDMVLELCIKSQASFVLCPCCYGGIHKTHLLTYPRSELYLQANISYTDFLTLGHAADQTEFDIKLEEQGRLCMSLVDTDRGEYAKQQGYDVTLCSLKPLSCSPKNNLLIGKFTKI